MLNDASDLIIVRSTIRLGHDLGLNVIAEGVEDEPDARAPAELGCDLAQGYHVSKPMPADAFNSWLTETPRQPANRTAQERRLRPRAPRPRAAPRRRRQGGGGAVPV